MSALFPYVSAACAWFPVGMPVPEFRLLVLALVFGSWHRPGRYVVSDINRWCLRASAVTYRYEFNSARASDPAADVASLDAEAPQLLFTDSRAFCAPDVSKVA